MPQKLLIVRITELVVVSNGDFPGSRPSHDDDLGLKNNSLIATLTYPRSGAPQVLSVKQYDLEDSKPATLVADDEFFDSLLFREEVFDRTVLRIKVTHLDESGKAGKFFLKLFSVIVGAGFSAVTGGLGGILGAVVGFGIDRLTGSIAGAGDQSVDVIGQAKQTLSMDAVTEQPQQIRLDLIAPETLIRRGFTFDPETHQAVEKDIVLTSKGQPNGHIVIEISALPMVSVIGQVA
jgi:hypothetical protein